MDTDEGFVPGIYNYCDRWCLTCAFTSRCRVFAGLASRQAAPVPRWLLDCIDEMNEAASEPQPIEDRARAYSFDVAGFLQSAGVPPDSDHADPRSILLHYCAFIPAKIHRALIGLADARENTDEGSADCDGSAKAALLAIERSRTAWIAMTERGLASIADAERFVSDLGRLADDLDREFPKARAFVRPGFDERPAENAA